MKASDDSFDFYEDGTNSHPIKMKKKRAHFIVNLLELQAVQAISCEYATGTSAFDDALMPQGAAWGYSPIIKAVGSHDAIAIIDGNESELTRFTTMNIRIDQTPSDLENPEYISGASGNIRHTPYDPPDVGYRGSPASLDMSLYIPAEIFTPVWNVLLTQSNKWEYVRLGFYTECYVGDKHYEYCYAMEHQAVQYIYLDYLTFMPAPSTVGIPGT